MADESHEISVGGELTATGIKAHIRSRLTSAVDRFFGSKLDKKTVPIEAENAEVAAMAAGRVRMIEALAEIGVQRVKTDPDFAARAIENFLPSMFQKQENKDAIVELAFQDIAANPPSDEESTTGPESLSDTFMNRFERYAEEATSDQVREKWAKVLAAEIRAPNTFSSKVMRVIDELAPLTAQLFERVCIHHSRGALFKASLGELSFAEVKTLVEAELLTEPGNGQVRQAATASDNGGADLWVWPIGTRAIALTVTVPPPADNPLANGLAILDGIPALHTYLLTDVGRALTAILSEKTDEIYEAVKQILIMAAPRSEIREYITPAGSSQMVLLHSLPPREA